MSARKKPARAQPIVQQRRLALAHQHAREIALAIADDLVEGVQLATLAARMIHLAAVVQELAAILQEDLGGGESAHRPRCTRCGKPLGVFVVPTEDGARHDVCPEDP